MRRFHNTMADDVNLDDIGMSTAFQIPETIPDTVIVQVLCLCCYGLQRASGWGTLRLIWDGGPFRGRRWVSKRLAGVPVLWTPWV